MLTKQELVQDMRSQNNGASLMCINDFKRYCGLDKETIREILRPVEVFKVTKRKKLYHVRELAEHLIKFKTLGL